MKTITVTIPQYGSPKVEANGFDGEGCAAATKPIEQALSGNIKADVEYKPEWSNPETHSEHEEETLKW
jgi:hypothetical protein